MQPKLAPGRFFGEKQKRRDVAGFCLTEHCYAPDFDIPPHAHESAFFRVVLQGACSETAGRRTYVSGPTTVTFMPLGETHANRWLDDGGRCFHVEVAPARLESVRAYSGSAERPVEFGKGLAAWLSFRLYQEFHLSDEISLLAMEGLALELLAEAFRRRESVPERRPPLWLEQARDLLHAQFLDPVSLEAIAGVVGVHPAHLARVFRQQYHSTIGDYVRKLRIEFACRQIASTDDSLLEIALSAGFSDQSHFCKTFKSLMGMTPAEFQKPFHACKSHTNR